MSDAATADPTTQATADVDQPDQPLNPRMRLFTLRVASNKEDRVRQNLERKRRIEGMENKIGRIIVPVKKVLQVKNGKRNYVDQKNYPGYVFIEIEPDEHGRIPQDVWFLVKETEGVGDFIQASGKPHPMGRDEALRMIGESEKKEDPEPETDFKPGDKIKVIVGAFEGFEGEVEKPMENGQVGIIITIFGRSTSLEVNGDELEKL